MVYRDNGFRAYLYGRVIEVEHIVHGFSYNAFYGIFYRYYGSCVFIVFTYSIILLTVEKGFCSTSFAGRRLKNWFLAVSQYEPCGPKNKSSLISLFISIILPCTVSLVKYIFIKTLYKKVEEMTNNVSAIKFGTDGWRAVVGQDFNFENVETVTKAIAQYILEKMGWKTRNHRL